MRSFVGDNSLPSSLPEVRPESIQEPIVPTTNQPPEPTASTEAVPSDGNDNSKSEISQPTSNEENSERRYPIRIRTPLVKYGAS